MRRIVTVTAPALSDADIRDLDAEPIRPLDLLVSEGVGLTAHTLGRIRRDVHSGPVCAAELRQAFEVYNGDGSGSLTRAAMAERVSELLTEHGFDLPHVCTPVR